jgi:restriction system protein
MSVLTTWLATSARAKRSFICAEIVKYYASRKMANVTCSNCGTVLDEKPGTAIHDRSPCPKCGSTVRAFSITADPGRIVLTGLTATLHATLDPLVLKATGRVIAVTTLLLQTVVVAAEKTSEGQLIEAVAFPWFDIIELLKNDPTIAYQIPPRKWEEIVAGAYKKAGFDDVILTPRSGDLGRDVIAIKQGIGRIRLIDQVKAYKPDHLVTADDVRGLMGVLQGDGASKGFLTTTSDFAPRLRDDPLIVPFIPSRLELINGSTLLERLQQLVKKT